MTLQTTDWSTWAQHALNKMDDLGMSNATRRMLERISQTGVEPSERLKEWVEKLRKYERGPE